MQAYEFLNRLLGVVANAPHVRAPLQSAPFEGVSGRTSYNFYTMPGPANVVENVKQKAVGFASRNAGPNVAASEMNRWDRRGLKANMEFMSGHPLDAFMRLGRGVVRTGQAVGKEYINRTIGRRPAEPASRLVPQPRIPMKSMSSDFMRKIGGY